jgi:fluoride exporter
MTFIQILAVGSGGMLGSIARYILTRTIDAKAGSLFPYGTLAVNVIGSFILGIIFAIAARKTGMDENWRLFFGTGVCGGFTTFSAFTLENFNLLQTRPLIAGLYMTVSLIAGIGAVALGIYAARTP